jgi:hypothetical protein
MTAVTGLLLELVAIPPVSPMTNQPVSDYAKGRLAARDRLMRDYCYTDANGTPKSNLIALSRNSSGHRAELAFVCHTDTAPFHPSWQEAVSPVLRGGLIGMGEIDCVPGKRPGLDAAVVRTRAVLIGKSTLRLRGCSHGESKYDSQRHEERVHTERALAAGVLRGTAAVWMPALREIRAFSIREIAGAGIYMSTVLQKGKGSQYRIVWQEAVWPGIPMKTQQFAGLSVFGQAAAGRGSRFVGVQPPSSRKSRIR